MSKSLVSDFNCVVDIAPDRFVFEEGNKKLSIPIMASHPLIENNHEIEYLIIMVHGGGLNANGSFETAHKIVGELELKSNRSLVLAPQIIEGIKLDEKGGAASANDPVRYSPEPVCLPCDRVSVRRLFSSGQMLCSPWQAPGLHIPDYPATGIAPGC